MKISSVQLRNYPNKYKPTKGRHNAWKYKTHKGVAYFPNYVDARQVAREVGGIVRNYIRGYAVQYYHIRRTLLS